MSKLGLIAGGGGLPVSLARHCRAVGREVFVLRLAAFADPALEAFDGCEVGLAQLGKAIAALRRSGCAAVCLAGSVARPDFGALRADRRGLAALPGAILAARRGDDALLGFLLGEFEKEGFAVEGADRVMESLTLSAGVLGRHRPSPEDLVDIERALAVAREIGRMDVGQGAVCCRGVTLATEAQEGTDAMLGRIPLLPKAIRGCPSAPRGVLAQACKPLQDRRVDLPTIGPATVRAAAQAGLAGIAGEVGRLLIVERETVIELADELGLFVFGAPPGP